MKPQVFFVLFLTLTVSNALLGQKVGINTLTPIADLHVVGSSYLFDDGVSNKVELNLSSLEAKFLSPNEIIFSTPTFDVSASSITLNAGNVSIGSSMSSTQQLAVNGAIQIGTTNVGTNGTIRFDNNRLQFYDGAWQSLLTDKSFTTNSSDNLIISTNDHTAELYDFIIGDKQLPFGSYTKKMSFFDVSKGSFRAGELNASNAWAETKIGLYSFATGLNNLAVGDGSFSAGKDNESHADLSVSFGNNNDCSAENTFAIGSYNEAPSQYEMVIGRFAETYTPASAVDWKSDDRIFTIGNGSSISSRNNLLTVLKNGSSYLDGDLYIGNDEALPSIALNENVTSGKIHGDIILRNENSTRADNLAILIDTDGSNNEPYIQMYRKDGTIGIKLDVDVSGDSRITTDELTIVGGSDFAEFFDIAAELEQEAKPGMLVSIDPINPGKITITQAKEDRKLVGIISGANGIETGMTMGQVGTIADGEYPIALSGRVYVYANEEGGSIAPGDFLTSSSQNGFAMKANIQSPSWGSIIGKAMTPIDENGFVLVLVNLQ